MDSLSSELCFQIALRSLHTVAHLLREEEQQDYFREVYAIARQEVGRYLQAAARRQQRLRPLPGE